MKKLISLLFVFSTVGLAQSNNQINNFPESSLSIFTSVYKYFFYPSEVLMVMLLLSFWIMYLSTSGRRVKASFKANIEKLRNEEIEAVPIKGLRRVRSSLAKKVKDTNEQNIIEEAKKHEIATGEIDLALRLKNIIKE